MAGKTFRKQNFHDLLGQMPGPSASFLRSQVSRRTVLSGVAGVAGLSLTGFAGTSATAQEATPTSNVWEPPADAAPLEDQIWRTATATGGAVALDFYERVYERPSVADLWSVALVFLSKEFEITPGAATEWSSDETGKVWTFTLRDDLMWSDGNPVTAADYVKTFQYAADPEHAWDFAWFWDGDLVNFTECLAGDVPLEELGVRQGANEYEVIFETVNPAPYLPAKLLYSLPLSKAALETHGPLYNSSAETAVSSGPFILSEWIPDQSITYLRNEAYTGPWPIALQKIVQKFAAPAQFFTLYEADEIDYMEGPAPAELQIMQADPEKEGEIYQGVGDFACLYFFFDVTTAPFDNKLVRQAFSHVIDREAMKQQIWGPQANAAPSFLAPGFPASNTEELASIQAFDPELGKQLLAEAGYPDGEGFPELVMTVRGNGTPLETATTQAYATMLKNHLNIDVELQTMDRQAFYADMKTIQFGWVSYGMDYFDPANMLSVWKTGGRHPWSNEEYDRLYDEATVFLGDPEERINMFKEVERILVEDVPAVWAYFVTPIQLIKPYITGAALEPDSNGIAAVHWPGLALNGSALHEIYVGADAPAGRQ
jgi:peptide/nickel transport system substrate-binding protein/oligopeptide transport system substrate-binding protein